MFGKKRSASKLRRVSRGLSEFKRVLIVCEGSKTEPNYFREVCQSLRLRTANVEIVGEECDSAPVSVYRYADARFRDEAGSYDKVFCVIDRDRHATFDDAVAACRSHPSKRFSPIRSYPCFEYWVLLHFRFTRAPIVAQGASSPGDVVISLVRDHWPQYLKGSRECFATLERQGLTATAVGNALRARRDAEATGEPNPSTEIDLLLEELRLLAAEQGIA